MVCRVPCVATGDERGEDGATVKLITMVLLLLLCLVVACGGGTDEAAPTPAPVVERADEGYLSERDVATIKARALAQNPDLWADRSDWLAVCDVWRSSGYDSDALGALYAGELITQKTHESALYILTGIERHVAIGIARSAGVFERLDVSAADRFVKNLAEELDGDELVREFCEEA